MADGLLIVDVQQALVDFLEPARRETFIATLGGLASRARAANVPIVYVRHNDEELQLGSEGWRVAAGIAPQAGEPIVDKQFGDSFKETNLAEVLEERGIDHVIVCGMQTEYCINATVRGAIERGYRTSLVEDAHATFPDGGKSEAEIASAVHAGLRATNAAFVSSSAAFV